MKKANIVLLAGDGIGPEVVDEGRRVLERVAVRFGHEFRFSEQLLGGVAIDATGDAFPTQTLQACESADAILLGAVGGPKWADPQAKLRPEHGLLAVPNPLALSPNL